MSSASLIIIKRESRSTGDCLNDAHTTSARQGTKISCYIFRDKLTWILGIRGVAGGGGGAGKAPLPSRKGYYLRRILFQLFREKVKKFSKKLIFLLGFRWKVYILFSIFLWIFGSHAQTFVGLNLFLQYIISRE